VGKSKFLLGKDKGHYSCLNLGQKLRKIYKQNKKL
jgi:hypothetical protein